jgi:hypothetical protein
MPPEPPRNGGYLVAAYVVTTVILLGYWLRLWLKGKKAYSIRPSASQGNAGQQHVLPQQRSH